MPIAGSGMIPDRSTAPGRTDRTALARGVGTERSPERGLTSGSEVLRIRFQGSMRLVTENLVPGNRVYNEKLILQKGIEYRTWEPHRSKLAASLMNGLEEFPFVDGTRVLYLGASTGTTVSHISDIVGPRGMVFAVEHASRVARELLDRVASHRRNVVPIVQDARHPREYSGMFGDADVVYSDIAQPNQTEIALANCDAYLKRGGMLLLVIKSRSIDSIASSESIVRRETAKLHEGFEVLQTIDLEPYDRHHAMITARRL